jgi:2-polyprenyl-3-methyl-5-hydroxy-6-metoxy-1,4-benzoquinol methylase
MHLIGNLDLSRYAFAATVAKRVLGSSPSRIVFDLGAGEGAMREPITEYGFSWFGFDRLPRDGAERWDLSQPCPLRSVKPDLVLCLDVIEHLVNPGIALDHIASVTPSRASLVMTTPNPRWSRSRLWALQSGFMICFTEPDLKGNGHVFPVWPHVLERMLLDRDFEITEYVTLDGATGWPGAPYSLRYPLRCAVAAAMIAIERRDRSACGMSYGIVARRN